MRLQTSHYKRTEGAEILSILHWRCTAAALAAFVKNNAAFNTPLEMPLWARGEVLRYVSYLLAFNTPLEMPMTAAAMKAMTAYESFQYSIGDASYLGS